MSQDLPFQLNYNSVKPVGYPAIQKEVKFYPITYQNAGTNDLVRFNISTNGFWDPWTTYFLVEVDYSGMGAEGNLQLDSSSHSLINQLIIQCKGVEIERKDEYDTIAAMLTDMGKGNCQPIEEHHTGKGSIIPINNYDCALDKPYSLENFNNVMTLRTGGYKPWLEFNTLNLQQQLTNYPANFNTSNIDPQSGWIANCRYDCQYYSSSGNCPQPHTLANYAPDGSVFGNATAQGLSKCYTKKMSSQNKEITLSKNYTKTEISLGLLWQPCVSTLWQTQIPVLSAFFGHLVPKQSYKYIPMQGLQNLEWQIRFNPYAFFTSGYLTPNAPNYQLNNNLMLPRTWSIKSICIVTELVLFDYNTERIINDQLNSDRGIILHSSDWMLGPMYPIAQGTQPSGTYQINLGFESLKNIVIMFIPDSYQTYTFLRKHFRICHNINYMQFKLGIDFYPPQALQGTTGNPCCYTVAPGDNNLQFMQSLYLAFAKQKEDYPGCTINAYNFAINERSFDFTNQQALVAGLTSSEQTINLDTTLGLPECWENQVVGKAMFAMNFENLDNGDDNIISGLNTINTKPFEVNFKSNGNTAVYPYNSTMYIFAHYDIMLQIKSIGLQLIGKG